MTKLPWKLLKLSPVIAATFFTASSALAAEEQVTPVAQIAQQNENLGQVTSVSQFSDVQPTDWAFQALQSLVERYGCIVGYPNGTYRGNRALTRYEFAAGLNACLDRVNELIATATADLVRKEDLATLQRLQEEFSAELATLRGRVDALEARTAELEAKQFSTTTKLAGEVIFSVSDVISSERAVPFGLTRSDLAGIDLTTTTTPIAAINTLRARGLDIQGSDAVIPGTGGATQRIQRARELLAAYGLGNLRNDREREIAGNTILADRVRLNFNTSFTGKDLLRVRFQARNVTPFGTAITGTNMTRLGYDGSDQGGNDFIIDDLFYRFDVSDAIRVQLDASNVEFNDNVFTFNPAFESSGNGAISRYGRFSPIYRQGSGGAGLTVTLAPNGPFSISAGFLAPNANDPSFGRGLINGSYAALGQIVFRPSQAFNIGFTYARTYYNQELSRDLFDSTGSYIANRPFANNATSANHYGVEAIFRPSPKFTVSGWGGYTEAEAETDGGPFEGAEAKMFYWAGAIALQDFGREGNTLGVIFGQPPKVSDSDVLEDVDTSYHLEALYKLRVSNNVTVTPGVIVIFNPEHNNDNDNIYVGTIRTTFTF